MHDSSRLAQPGRAFLCGPLLKGVSRSFYLTLRVLPARMRTPVGLAYLLARAADTIADTSLITPSQRLDLLLSLRGQVNGKPDEAALAHIASEVAKQQAQSDEKTLLASLGPAIALLAQLGETDRAAVRQIVTTLTEGMEFDLRTFPDEHSGKIIALRDMAQLDRYTYLVAGCVGEFWTTMSRAHSPGILANAQDFDVALQRGVRFGKALQMTNVLRDCGKDLRMGRCYLPQTLLAQHHLTPESLLQPDASQRARALLCDLLRVTLDHFRAALDYTLALPRTAIRLRLACLWPVLIGLHTLLLLAHNDDWLDPAKASRISRSKVYRILAGSALQVGCNTSLRAGANRLIAQIERQLASVSV
jgi:farnesyl-diphosphate farnesyltransferase